MGKSSKLDKFRFKLRAKGRHGTHSPFVYAFVEAVLRHNLFSPDCPSVMSPKEWNLLNATLAFMKPSKLFLGKYESNELMDLIGKRDAQHAFQLVSDQKEIMGNDDVFVIVNSSHLKEINSLFHLQVKGNGRLSIYVLQPRALQVQDPLCDLIENPGYRMVLDFWDAILFIQNNDFKEKQFFELK